MIFVSDVDTEALEFSHELFDLLFGRIAPHIAKVLVGRSTQDFVDDPS